MDHPLTPDECKALDSLAREVLRAAAEAREPARSLAWAEAACACLRVAIEPERALKPAGALLDALPPDAPFADAWRRVLAPIAARAEAMLNRDVEEDVDRLAEELARH